MSILHRKISHLLGGVRSAFVSEHDQRVSHWRLHPQADYFLAHGGEEISPPSSCNIGLTNKCNLRCEICGSQKNVGVRRRHMGLETFEAVAETIFPLLGSVELNSQGDPLLYPHIAVVLERIRSHGCQIKVQTNGTLFTDHVLSLLLEQRGTVMLSLDAVGPKFDEVRRGGNWSKAEPGLQQFLSSRDPARLSVGIYPTLTQRTIGEALNVVAWAAEHGVDQVVFHRYVPILESWEKPPSDEAYRATRRRLADWLAANGEPIEVRFESDVINRRAIRRRDLSHEKFPFSRVPASIPIEANIAGAHKLDICHAPMSYLEVGLEGQIAACCRSQDVPLGYATSVESFADAWFGANYKRIRRSLQRHYGGSYTLPNCEACVKFFAPVAGGTRKSVDYAGTKHSEDALDFTHVDEILIDEMRSERGRCFVARIPPGVNHKRTALYENGQLLSAHCSQHDDIREFGGGAFAVSGQSLYFSSSDGSDPRRNGRQYCLRPLPFLDDEIELGMLVHDGGHAFVAELDRSIEAHALVLLEDGRALDGPHSLHDDIRTGGRGRYSVWDKSLYFSTSDNSDPRSNGRHYRLRQIAD
ncbi:MULTISPECIES: radical SAM protein [Bradyrhizobium]|uniref:radical SAM protein n=1 Tax=Bradyrhizobium brasilense TaxID=1419277 RepID=UPI001456B55C|nr:radical SAM protein [Bradyrhizobium brasilense]NLS67605.1 radical SAM protein [Bradyrhizobium brasilense]